MFKRSRALVVRSVPALPEEGFLRLPQVLQVVPVAKSTWWLWISQKKAPAGVKLSDRVTVWKVSDIRAFIARQGAVGADSSPKAA
jgi:predicted DNA-binding transcriptional regulator AlpA